MAWDDDLENLMATTVAVTASGPATRSAYGVESFAGVSSSTYRARLVTTSEQVTSDEGQIVQAEHVAWIASTGTLTVAMKYVFPTLTAPALKVTRWPDEDGTYVHKVWFGR